MTCNFDTYTITTNSSESTLSTTLPPLSGGSAERVLLPHSGSPKVLQHQVQIVGSDALQIHLMFQDGLYLEKQVRQTNTITKTYNQVIDCGVAYPETVPAPEVQTVSEDLTKYETGSVTIRWCLLAEPCSGGGSPVVFATGTQTISGFSQEMVTRHIEVPFTFDFGCIRDLPNIILNEDTPIYLRLERTDTTPGSSTGVYYIGYSITAGDAWTNANLTATPAPNTQAAPPTSTNPGVSVPATSITDDSLEPSHLPGGVLQTTTCGDSGGGDSGGGDSGGGDPPPPTGDCLCDMANVGDGEGEIYRDKTDDTFNLRTLKAGSNITITTNGDVVEINSTASGGSLPITLTKQSYPSISASPAVMVYTPETTANAMPAFSATADTTNCSVIITLDLGIGEIKTTATVAGVTSSWNASAKSFTVQGPVADVNQVLAALTYDSPTGEAGDIKFGGKVIDDDTKEGRLCGGSVKLVQSETGIRGQSASARVCLTGTNGSVQIKVNGVAIHTNAINFSTSLYVTAQNVVNDINSSSTTPNYTAALDEDTGDILIAAPVGLGSDANGFTISGTTTGDLALGCDTKLDGGVTDTTTPFDFIDDIFDWDTLAQIAGGTLGGVLSYMLMPDVGTTEITIPVTSIGELNYEEDIAFLYKGRVVKVPNVYDPATYTYSGAWDGVTFQEAWTNDPAWCLRDYLTNNSFGAGKLVNLSAANLALLDQDLYKCSLRNNEMVSNGNGGTEPRYTLNTVVEANMSKLEAIQSIASSMHAKVIWHHGMLRVSQDRPDDVKWVFNNTNVEDGEIDWSGGSLSTAYSVANVLWNNPARYYRQDVVYAEDEVMSERFGEKAIEELAFGCTSRGQAVRHALWVLQTERLEPQEVNFIAGWDAWDVMPGDIISVEDDFKSRNPLCGRYTLAASNVMEIVQPVTMTSDTYQVRCMTTNGAEEFTVTGIQDSNGNSLSMSTTQTDVKFLQIDGSISGITGAPVVNIFGTGTGRGEKLFRVVKITETKFGAFGVTAVRYYPDKYTYIDANYQF